MSLAEIKAKLVDAHRRQDWEAAKLLSQEKVKALHHPRVCVDCGVPTRGMRCRLHHTAHRYHKRSLDFPAVEIKASVKSKNTALSARQCDILRWRLMGFQPKGIADAMKISAKTVEHHWACIKGKLGLQDVVEICCWFCKNQKGSAHPRKETDYVPHCD